MGWLTKLRDRLLIADPGFVRLDTAARTTAAVALTTVVMLLVVTLSGASQVAVLVAAIASWISSISVSDVKLSDRRVTTLLIPLPAIAGLALGAAVSGKHLLEDAVFLAVLFASVYVRRFGPRYTALGVVFTFSYFFSLFVGTTAQQLPALMGALVAGTASTFTMRYLFFPKHARGSLWSVMQSILAQQRLAIERSREARVAGGARVEFVVRNIARINETMLAVQEQGVIAGAFDDLAFRCELAAENLFVASAGTDPRPQGRAAAEHAMALATEAVRLAAASRAADPRTSSPQRDAILHEVQRKTPDLQYRLRSTTRQAIQVTAAAAAAIAIGEHISEQRWYWAVITAFIVFSGTTSAGETLARALAGLLGTSIGVIAGFVIGALIRHDVALESWLLFVSMLFAAYFIRSGYGVTSFFITMMIVTLYELLGKFTDQILLVRLLEIATGVASGGLAATVLLPTSTRRVFRSDVRLALEALRDGLGVLVNDGCIEAQAAARRFDAAIRRLRSRVGPRRSGPTFAGASEFARCWLWAMELCGYYVRNAVIAQSDDAQPLDAAAAKATAIIDALLSAIETDEAWPSSASPPAELALPQYARSAAGAFIAQVGDLLERLSVGR